MRQAFTLQHLQPHLVSTRELQELACETGDCKAILTLKNDKDSTKKQSKQSDTVTASSQTELPQPQQRRDVKYRVYSGPFSKKLFRQLGKHEDAFAQPDACYSLLVCEVNFLKERVSRLLDYFKFIPNYRLDDVMFSTSTQYGSAGPHVDSYDVFLIQAQGKKLWMINNPNNTQSPLREPPPLAQIHMLLTLSPQDRGKAVVAQHPQPTTTTSASATLKKLFDQHCDSNPTRLAIVKDFKFNEMYLMEPGDVLYLPPNVHHYGVSIVDDEPAVAAVAAGEADDQRASVTVSIGFRAPSHLELRQNFFSHFHQQYADFVKSHHHHHHYHHQNRGDNASNNPKEEEDEECFVYYDEEENDGNKLLYEDKDDLVEQQSPSYIGDVALSKIRNILLEAPDPLARKFVEVSVSKADIYRWFATFITEPKFESWTCALDEAEEEGLTLEEFKQRVQRSGSIRRTHACRFVWIRTCKDNEDGSMTDNSVALLHHNHNHYHVYVYMEGHEFEVDSEEQAMFICDHDPQFAVADIESADARSPRRGLLWETLFRAYKEGFFVL